MNDAAEDKEAETKEAPEATEVEETEAEEKPSEPEAKKAEGPIALDETDRLKAENVNLRLLNAVNRETLAQHALQEAGRQRQEANQKVMVMRAEIEKKYEIDLRTHQIDETTGAVTPRGLPPHLQALTGGRG